MKEWYLMNNHKPNTVSGYEGDILTDFAQSNFTDVLETAFSDAVLLYNHDLSECKEIRCVIQGNSADTYLKSMERVALFPIGTVKAGMYIFFENRYWLITGYPSSNKSYEKATVKLCQYKVKWQNSDGTIVERWVSTQSSSKYDDGLKDSNTMTLTSDSIMLLLPNDDESLTLDGKRIFIDKKNPPNKVYLVSRADSVLYDYGEERYAPKIAAAICSRREEKPIRTTLELVDVIKSAMPAAAKKEKQHPAKRSFQAVRIQVNGELRAVETAVADALDCLNPGSLEILNGAKLEASLADVAVTDRFQFLRMGYFCADKDSKPGKLIFNRAVGLKDGFKK